MLNELPEERKDCYILCEVDTKNYDEMANITGVPVGTVKVKIFETKTIFNGEFKKDRL
ncbi:MAG: hypothetical protein CM15mP22_8100 [Gammaproteobacteria bacterium]|nr:MAG: hypothetical protein CM15mP22_8100 [Gammaproteobacteria bacterium]